MIQDVVNLKTTLVEQKKISNILDNEAVKNTEFNTLKKKVINLAKKIPDSTTLIHINQCNTDEQNLKNKIGDVHKKIPDTNGVATTTIWNKKINEVENKISNPGSLLTTNVLNTKHSKVANKIPNHAEYITT